MFERLNVLLTTLVTGYAGTVSAALAAGLAAPALALVTAQIALFGLAVMRGEASEPVGAFAWKMAKTVAIVAFATGGIYYASYVLPLATELQDDMATLFVRGLPAGTSAFGALDAANHQANDLLKLLWRDAGLHRFDLVIASVLFSLGTAALLIVGLAVSFTARVLMVFALAVGPLFILGLLFRPTARFFDSWLSMLLSAAAMSWFVFFALGISLAVAERVAQAILLGGAFTPGPDGVNAIEASLTWLALMAALAFVLAQAPRLAAALTGGPAVQSGIAMVAGLVGGPSSGRGQSAHPGARDYRAAAGGSISPIPGAYGVGHLAGGAVRHAYQRIATRQRG